MTRSLISGRIDFMKIYLATGNKNKKREIQQILPNHEILIPSDEGIAFDPDETGSTFYENSIIKAKTLYDIVHAPVIADDSGICVDALGGAPGIYSARYAGPEYMQGRPDGKKIPQEEQNVFLIEQLNQAVKSGNFISKIYKNTLISFKNKALKIKKSAKIQTDFVFSVIIEEEGRYALHFGELDVVKNAVGGFSLSFEGKVILPSCQLPLCLRSSLFDDQILCADGGMKKVSDVLAQWHLPESERGKIPVIQDLSDRNQQIICILGQVFGFDNWIVK